MDFLDRLFFDEWIVFALPGAVLLLCAEVGFRLGRRAYDTHPENHGARQGAVSGVQTAILGLLGLLLGFTFALATARYDVRRELIVKDANAIGTAYLRTSLLPEAHVAPVRELLRQYLSLRIVYFPLADDPAKLAEGLQKSAGLQHQLWDHAVAAGKESPSAMTSLFIDALNATFDVEGERLAAAAARIPPVVWVLVLVVGALGCLTSSYLSGAAGARSPFSSFVLPLLIAIVITLIFDLMHPREGLIGLSQKPLADLQSSLAPDR